MSNEDFSKKYLELKKYSMNLISVNYVKTGEYLSIIKPNDLVNEAISYGYLELDQAKKFIRNYFIKESIKQRASRQFSGISYNYYKVCNKCKKNKNSDDFYERYDNRIDLIYLSNNCKECENKRNKKYQNSEKGKANAKIRYERWKEKNKKIA